MNKSRNFSMIEYLKLRAGTQKPKYRFKGKTRADFDIWKDKLLGELKEALGPMPEPADLNPQVVWEIEQDGIIKRRVIIDLEEHMSAAALVFIPKSGSKVKPAILCNHGHGDYGKDSIMGIRSANEPARNAEIETYNCDYGLQMAKRGYVTMAIDWRGFGERSDGGNPYPDRDKCNVHFIRGSIMNINLLALDIFDGMRCIDYLCGLDCVDSERIGAMGLSFGGTMTTWITLMDQRVKAADIICYSCRFESFAVDRGQFCGSQMFAGIFDLCDIPDLHGLIAPRPLLAEIGVHDKVFYAEEAFSCSTEVAKIYQAAGASGNYEVDVFDGDHKFAGNEAFEFFNKHLKKKEYVK